MRGITRCNFITQSRKGAKKGLVAPSILYLPRRPENPANTPINTVSTLPPPNGYGVGMRTQTKSAIVLLTGGIFANRLTRARHGVAADMDPIYARS